MSRSARPIAATPAELLDVCSAAMARPANRSSTFPTYPHGFPVEVVDEFARRTGRPVIGNVVGSGTEVIERFGPEHERIGAWILYTSADSVFQVAAHEDVVPIVELYEACRTARASFVHE